MYNISFHNFMLLFYFPCIKIVWLLEPPLAHCASALHSPKAVPYSIVSYVVCKSEKEIGAGGGGRFKINDC